MVLTQRRRLHRRNQRAALYSVTNLMPASWIIARPLAAGTEDMRSDHRWAFLIIGAYVIASLIYGFLSDAPWDDDCVVRYFHARAAWSEPEHFFSVWNRPLFMVLFAPAALLGREAMMVQMILLSAWSGWLLYRSLQRIGAVDAYWVLPFFFFQAFYFSISRNFLTEPVAVAVICLGLHALVNGRYTLFAVLGGLLPLARLELVAILPIWGIALMQAGQWKRIAWMAAPVLLLMVLGYIVKDTDNPLWLVEDTLGKEGKNRYGYRNVWHYFQRYAYVVGPVVFFFLVIGVLERLFRRRIDLFILVQGSAVLLLYVVFSSKLDMGNSAGFLRNLIPMTPFVAVLAYDGLMAWQGRAHRSALESAPAVPDSRAERRKLQKAKSVKQESNPWWSIGRVHLFGALAVALLWLYFSKELEGHHKISEKAAHGPAIIGTALLFLGLPFLLIWRMKAPPRWVLATTAGLASATALAYALWSEKPDAHLNPERKAVTELSSLYRTSYLREWPLYANHAWFFWPRDLGYPDPERYRTLNKAALDSAESHSVVLWENHYSHRLQGDLRMADMYKRKDLVELAHVVSSDHRATACFFQKTDGTPDDAAALRERFMQAHPENVYAYYAVNLEHSRAKRFDDALQMAERMIAIDSTYVDGWLAQGQARFDLARYDEAISSFEHVMRMDTALFEMQYSIALCEFRKKEHAASERTARDFLKRSPKSKKGYELLGAACFHQKKYDAAVAAFDAYIKLDPKSTVGWMNRASSRMQQQKWDSALADIEEVLKRDPSNRSALLNKAALLIRKGRRDEGCQLLRQLAAAGDAAAAQQLAVCGR